jgi:hypothetical protein
LRKERGIHAASLVDYIGALANFERSVYADGEAA